MVGIWSVGLKGLKKLTPQQQPGSHCGADDDDDDDDDDGDDGDDGDDDEEMSVSLVEETGVPGH